MFWLNFDDIYYINYAGSEISGVQENNVELTAAASLVAMTAGSFFHLITVDVNYIFMWPTNSDNPNTNENVYILNAWLGFSSRAGISYPIQGVANDYPYMPQIDPRGMPSINQSTSKPWVSVSVSDLGALGFLDVGWWLRNEDNFIVSGSDAVVKHGVVGDAYGSLTTVMRGIVSNPAITETGVSLEFTDVSVRELATIPPNVITNPDAGENIGKVSPVLLGAKTNITPLLIDETNFTYLITQTDFVISGLTPIHFDMESVDAVYKDGNLLTLTTDYTQDLTAGTVTLNVDPGSLPVTVDAHGLDVDYNFSTPAWTGAASSSFADHAYFAISVLNSTPNARINLPSFQTVKTDNVRENGWYITEKIDASAWISLLQQAGQVNIVPNAEGKISLFNYNESTAPTFFINKRDIVDFKKYSDEQATHANIFVQYDQDPTTGVYKTVTRTRDLTRFSYGTDRTFPVETLALTAEDARDIGDFFLNRMDKPATMISFHYRPPFIGWPLIPSEKIGLSYDITDDTGPFTVYDTESFMILSLAKTASDGTVFITAQKDPAQIHGFSITNELGEILVNESAEEITT